MHPPGRNKSSPEPQDASQERHHHTQPTQNYSYGGTEI
jgi:hypothetical protein